MSFANTKILGNQQMDVFSEIFHNVNSKVIKNEDKIWVKNLKWPGLPLRYWLVGSRGLSQGRNRPAPG